MQQNSNIQQAIIQIKLQINAADIWFQEIETVCWVSFLSPTYDTMMLQEIENIFSNPGDHDKERSDDFMELFSIK
jgi:hypothetical protein